MLGKFHVAERGSGSYGLLVILRWVMILIFVSFGIQKFTTAIGTRNCPLIYPIARLGLPGCRFSV